MPDHSQYIPVSGFNSEVMQSSFCKSHAGLHGSSCLAHPRYQFALEEDLEIQHRLEEQ